MAVEDLFKECIKMINLTHPNVLTLRGVCIDRGPVPYIILPYMANGSLLNYLKKNKAFFMLSDCSQVNKILSIILCLWHFSTNYVCI